MKGREIEDQLTLYGQSSASRLLLGTARYDSPSLLADAISAADPAMLTVSLRRQVSGSKRFWPILLESASGERSDDSAQYSRLSLRA